MTTQYTWNENEILQAQERIADLEHSLQLIKNGDLFYDIIKQLFNKSEVLESDCNPNTKRYNLALKIAKVAIKQAIKNGDFGMNQDEWNDYSNVDDN